jgi:hypothetical protein
MLRTNKIRNSRKFKYEDTVWKAEFRVQSLFEQKNSKPFGRRNLCCVVVSAASTLQEPSGHCNTAVTVRCPFACILMVMSLPARDDPQAASTGDMKRCLAAEALKKAEKRVSKAN